MTLEKTYNPQAIEQSVYAFWEEKKYFEITPQSSILNPQSSYTIVLPPPNVTGSLHMGHGFQDSLMDALTRYHRMQGYDVLWQGGTDHAGIATQMVVERQLLAEGKTRHQLGREEFLKRVWAWKHESGDTIYNQLKRMGSSIDWSRVCFTLDDHFSAAVRKAFVSLHDEGLIYRGQRLVNWDPTLHTAVSDLEVQTEEKPGHLWHIRYPLVDESDSLIVATTRPETLFGDSAVAVHPDDDRYKHLIGKQLKLPLTDRLIPIIADTYVDPTFGTGCVKITPAHDFNDYEVGKRHQLPLINIFTADAHLNENAPKNYQGLKRFDARKKVLSDLTALELLVKEEKYTLKLPIGDRSGDILEPWLTHQWFVKTAPLAKPAIEAVEDGRVKFIPENWSKTYFQWMNNIQDWCISRQLWWGHRIPAWYDEAGKIYVGLDEKDVRQKYQLNDRIALAQDEDVLDTWFSSALWPFATLGWPNETPELKHYYPTSTLVTGFDIIFFWVARMMMFGLHFMKEVPFREIYITGLIRDPDGHKMSKSKGNVIDPLDLIDGIDLAALIKKRTQGLMQPALAAKIEQATRKQFPEGIAAHGTDALRLTFCSLASTGRDIRFDLGRLEGYRNFCNKLWNATRYVLMNCSDKKIDISSDAHRSFADRWILSQLQNTITEVHSHFKTYRFDLLIQTLYDFTWHAYCDWYLEFSKVILNNPESTLEEKAATQSTLITVLEALLRLWHPIIPFITETLWQQVAPFAGITAESIMLQPYPIADQNQRDETIEIDMQWLQKIILALRTMRSEMAIPPSQIVTLLLRHGDQQDSHHLQQLNQYIKTLAKIGEIKWLSNIEEPKAAIAGICGTLELFIPMAGLIDLDAEAARLQKEIAKIEKDLEKTQAKLSNADFCARAPETVVIKEKERLQDMQQAIEKLKAQIEKLKTM